MAAQDARSDEQLMSDCAAGDLAAFECLVLRYERRILSYAYRYLRDYDLARDIYQQAFLNVFEKRTQYRQTARFSTYIYCIAHNLCQNELRRAERRRTSSLDSHGDAASREHDATPADWLPSESDDALPPHVALSREEEDGLVHEAIDALDPIYREVVALRIFEDLPFKDIAEITGVGESTVKSRMRYALGYLDKALRGQVRPET